MSRYGPISLLVGGIIGVAGLMIQLNVMSRVTEAIGTGFEPYEYRTETVAAAAEAAAQRSYEILDAKGRKTPVKRAAPLLAPGRFTDGRTARFDTFVDPARLLQAGETMPEGEMQALMVEARAARLADAACLRLRATLAAECGVRSFEAERVGPVEDWMDEARAHRHAPFVGHYLLTTTMVFTPTAAVGVLPESPRVTLNQKTFKLDPWTGAVPSAEAVAARTDDVMAAAARACVDIRAIHGNCTVTGVELRGSRQEAGEFRGTFELAWLTPVQGAAVSELEAAAPVAPDDVVPVAPDAPDPAPAVPEAAPAPGAEFEPAEPRARPAAPLKGGKAGKWVSP